MTETLVEMLQRGESRERGYNDYNRYAPRPGGSGHFRGPDTQIDFSQMTLGEIQRNQNLPWNHRDKLHAVGRYQIIGDTLEEAVAGMRLQSSDRFTPELQDRILVDYLLDEKRPDIRGYITGREGVTLREAQVAMANEWASVAHPTSGRSVYPNNHATITPAQSAEALQQAREQYTAAVAQGQTPDEAWKTAAGLGQQPTQTRTPEQAPTQLHPDASRTQTQSPTHAVLKQGSEGAEVWGLQITLAKLGYAGKDGRALAADSTFGPSTDHAVRAFQQAQGLQPVDGKVGKDTRAALVQAAQHPLVSEATHPNHALFTAIGNQLPAGTKPEVTANITLQALENGITGPDRLKGLVVQGSDVHLQGPFQGSRISVDLTAPTPTLQQMSDHMVQQSQLAQQPQPQQQRTQILQ